MWFMDIAVIVGETIKLLHACPSPHTRDQDNSCNYGVQ